MNGGGSSRLCGGPERRASESAVDGWPRIENSSARSLIEYFPVPCIRRSSFCCLSDSFGCLPRSLPFARAIAIPSRVRSRIAFASWLSFTDCSRLAPYTGAIKPCSNANEISADKGRHKSNQTAVGRFTSDWSRGLSPLPERVVSFTLRCGYCLSISQLHQ
jgi:hypothetical protein